MADVFLHYPLASDGILDVLRGGEARPVVREGTLPGFAVVGDGETPWPRLVRSDGAEASGRIVSGSSRVRDRIAFCLAALSGRACRLSPPDGQGPLVAFPSPSNAASGPPAAQPEPATYALILEAFREIAAHYGAREAQELPDMLTAIGHRALARSRGAGAHSPGSLRSGLGSGDVESVAVTRPYARFFGVETHRLRHRRFDGEMSEIVERSVFVSGDAITVVPFDPGRRTILLIEQFRTGALARQDPHPWFLEAIAGRCDRVEAPEDAARREAAEEAGLTLGRLERLGAYYTSPGIASEYITAFVGEADLDAAHDRVHGLAEEHEDIRSIVLPLAEAMGAVGTGEIRNSPLLVTLFWLDRNADRLAAEWNRPATA